MHTGWVVTCVMMLLISGLGAASALADQGPGSPTGPYKGFGFPWENNTLGIDRKVPAPWTPVQRKDNVLSVWGRTVRLAGAGLPRQITTQSEPLLARPATMDLVVDGHAVDTLATRPFFLPQQHPDRIEARTVVDAGKLKLTVLTSLEFDGLLRFDLTLAPDGGTPRIDRLLVKVPFSRSVARYVSRDFEYDYVEMRANRRDLINSTFELTESTAMPFNHHVWIGSRQVGCEFEAETNLHWSTTDPSKEIELVVDKDAAVLQLNVVTAPRKIDKPVTLSFALLPTPYKPMMTNWRTLVMTNVALAKHLRRELDPSKLRWPPYIGPGLKMAGHGKERGYDPKLWRLSTTCYHTPVEIPLEWPGMPYPPSDAPRRARYDAVRQALAAMHIEYIPYSALMDIHANVPELHSYWRWWMRNPEETGGRAWGIVKAARPPFAPGKTGQNFPVHFRPKSIQDYFVWTYVQSIKQWKQDGLYFDIGGKFDSVVNPTSARVDIRGKKHKQYRPVFDTREFHKRLYKATKALDPTYLLTQHQSKVSKISAVFFDVIHTGEAMNAYFLDTGRQMKADGKLPKDHPGYLPDHSLFPDAHWEADYNQNFGCVNMFFANVVKWNVQYMKDHPEKLERWTRVAMSRTLVHDIPFWRARLHTPTYDNLMWGYQQHFGGLRDPLEFVGPWEVDRILTEPPKEKHLKVGAYVRPDGPVVLIVANWGKKDLTARLPVNVKGLGLEAITETVDIEGRHTFKHDGSAVTVTVPGDDFRVVLVK